MLWKLMKIILDEESGLLHQRDLQMKGAEIFNFTIKVVPSTVSKILDKAGLTIDDISLFVFIRQTDISLNI